MRQQQPSNKKAIHAALVIIIVLAVFALGMEWSEETVLASSWKTISSSTFRRHYKYYNYDDWSSLPGTWISQTINEDTVSPALVVQLKGELGNYLGFLLQGFGVKWYANETMGLELRMMVKHINKGHWDYGRNDMKNCFPNFRHWNFDRGDDWEEFNERTEQQTALLSQNHSNQLMLLNGRKMQGSKHDRHPVAESDVDEALEVYIDEWFQLSPWRQEHNLSKRQKGNIVLSMPFLFSKVQGGMLWVDRYYDRIRSLFAFDSAATKCCGLRPDPDETVYHFRNFVTENPKNKDGLVDFEPEQAARDLLGHLQPGDKVALLTRFDDARAYAQVEALRQRGLEVRVIQGQSGVQDLCFLMHAQKEVVGNFLSTFAFWGGLLGSAKVVRLYTPIGNRIRKRYQTEANLQRRFLYNWTHPMLKERLVLSMLELDE